MLDWGEGGGGEAGEGGGGAGCVVFFLINRSLMCLCSEKTNFDGRVGFYNRIRR